MESHRYRLFGDFQYYIILIVTSFYPTEFEIKLRQIKVMREKGALNKTPSTQGKEYVEIDRDTGKVKLVSNREDRMLHPYLQSKKPPPGPIKYSQSPSSSENITPKRKPLPPLPRLKPPKPKPRRIQVKPRREEAKQVDFVATDSESSDLLVYQNVLEHPTSTTHQLPFSNASKNESSVPKRKPLPPVPAKKPIEPPKPKPRRFQSKKEAAPRVSSMAESMAEVHILYSINLMVVS